MKRRLFDLVRCPMCRGALRATPCAERDEIEEGVLACGGCARVYPVIRGVPRLLPDALAHVVPAMHPEFFSRHAAPMAPYLERCSQSEAGRAVEAKRRTIASYSDTATEIRAWYEEAALERVHLAKPWDGRAIGYAPDA